MTLQQRKKKSSKAAYKLATRLSAIVVPIVVALFLIQVWKSQADQKKSVIIEDARTKYEIALEEGDARDIKKQIELMLEIDDVALPLHIENLNKRITLSDRMIEISQEPKLSKFAFETRLNALLEKNVISVKHGISDAYTTALLQDEKNNPDIAKYDLQPLANIAYSYSAVSEFLAKRNVDARTRDREDAFEAFKAALKMCDIEDHRLAFRMSELVDLINDHGSTAEGIAFSKSFIEHFKATGNIRIQSVVNDKTFGLQRTAIVLPEFLTSLPEQRQAIIQDILITLDNAASENKVDRETAEAALRRVKDMIRLGHYQEAGILTQKLRSLVDRIPDGDDRLDRFEAQLKRYKRPFQFNGIVTVSGQRLRLDPQKSINRLLLFASAASYQKSVTLFQNLAKDLNAELESRNTRLFLVYVDNGRSPRALKQMKEYAKKTRVATVWFVHTNRAGTTDVLKENFINQLPFIVVLDSDKRIIAANPPPAAVKDLIPK